MKKKVLLPERIHPIGSTYLEERGYELLYGSCEPEVIMKKLPECQAVITRNAKITREMMEGAPSLRVIARHGVGVDLIDTDSAAELGIWVTNAPQSNTNSVAEQVIGAMLSVARHFYPCQTDHDFSGKLSSADTDLRDGIVWENPWNHRIWKNRLFCGAKGVLGAEYEHPGIRSLPKTKGPGISNPTGRHPEGIAGGFGCSVSSRPFIKQQLSHDRKGAIFLDEGRGHPD